MCIRDSSAYSPRTEVTTTAVEFVSWTLSEAAKDMLSLSKPIYKRRSIPLDAIAALLVPWVIACVSASIPVTPPPGSPISNFLVVESQARTLTVSFEPPILIVVVAPGVNEPTRVSTVKTMLYLNTLPAAPEVADKASSATNSCSLPEPVSYTHLTLPTKA